MKPYWSNENATLWQGHVLDALDAMEAQSVHMACTSPPYWSQRDYGTAGVEWPAVSYAPLPGLAEIEIPGCAVGCAHVWVTERVYTEKSAAKQSKEAFSEAGPANAERVKEARWRTHQYCQLCGGWRGSLGLERTIEEYVGHIVLIWRALWRVLRDDGVCWLNLGDAYSGSNAAQGGDGSSGTAHGKQGEPGVMARQAHRTSQNLSTKTGAGLKPKDLCGIPWRCALALQADGWYLRSAPPWIKPNCMPESVTDRATTAHEFWFQLAKSPRYYWDATAVREAQAQGTIDRFGNGNAPRKIRGPKYANANLDSVRTDSTGEQGILPAGRNRRTSDTWNESLDARIAFYHDQLAHLEHVKEHGGLLLDENDDPLGLMFSTRGYKGAHFATFNGALIAPMIKAGTSARGVCPECGASWKRAVERSSKKHPPQLQDHLPIEGRRDNGTRGNRTANVGQYQGDTTTTGWSPTCSCYDALYYSDLPKPKDPRKWSQRAASGNWFKRARKRPGLGHWPVEPATVLDIFAGSGTTLVEAIRLGRHGVGIELSKAYCREHIIPRLSEPLFEWAQEQPEVETEPAPVQGVLL